MIVSYEKLWKLMAKNKMKKSELAEGAHISKYMMNRLNKSEPVNLAVLMRLCKVFHCNIGDIVDVIEDEEY